MNDIYEKEVWIKRYKFREQVQVEVEPGAQDWHGFKKILGDVLRGFPGAMEAVLEAIRRPCPA
jgi:hypothetical protein